MENFHPINKRIKQIIDYKTNGVVSKFAESIGIAQQTINRLFTIDKRTQKYPVATTEIVVAISEMYVDVSSEWLLTGKGEMIKKSKKKVSINHFPSRTDRAVNQQVIPLYDMAVFAGAVSIFKDMRSQEPIDELVIPNAPKCDGGMYVRGDSMYPLFKAGDIICFKTVFNLDLIIWGEIYLVDFGIDGSDYLLLKFVQKSEKGDDYICLVSQNSHHQPVDIHKSHIRAIAQVKLSVRYNTMS